MNSNAWHTECTLREDVRSGSLNLAEFAADLYSVRTGDAPNVYRLPDQFFDRTYPTRNLKRLVREVLRRLAGEDGNPVITVQVAYGGGKTHSLITLLHLAERGIEFQAHPTVQEFMEDSELTTLPRARVALLPFDKFDVKDGLSVLGPDGKQRHVNTPWGALAYQLAGEAGLAKVAAHDRDYVPPAEPTLVELLRAPQKQGMSTLILLDEALMYARGAVNDNPDRFGTLQDFFQGLTQAVDKVEHAAIVASLIAAEISADDPTGTNVLTMLEGVFRRTEKPVEPVSRDDIAELLRRRLFESVIPEEKRKPIVKRLLAAREKLSLDTTQSDNPEAALLKSYPFHPDLIEVLYQKWTQLKGFQGTRGMFRTFALMLKEAERKDTAPFVGPSTLLATDTELSDALQELINACEESNKWTPILNGELDRARAVQTQLPQLEHREVEAAVLATFLHSQPTGQSAEDTDLYRLVAHADMDAASLEKGLDAWRERSWFLKEDPARWSLSITTNLTRMHVRAMERLTDEQITDDLVQRVRDASLGRKRDGVALHTLPTSRTDVPDTPELHFVIANPKDTARPGEAVSETLTAFFDGTFPNNVLILAADTNRLYTLRESIRKILGWHNIEQNENEMRSLTESQRTQLLTRKRKDENSIADSVIGAYNVLIAVNPDGNIEASTIPTSGNDSPFERVKTKLTSDDRLIQATLDPALITPTGPYELWGPDETAKPVQDFYRMFGSLPRLPRLLNQQVLLETLRRAAEEGQIVLQSTRPDGTQLTYWREAPTTETELRDRNFDIVPIQHAKLDTLRPNLFVPGKLQEVWPDENAPISVEALRAFFDGAQAPTIANPNVLFTAIQTAVKNGMLMACHQDNAYQNEPIPDDARNDTLQLRKPIAQIQHAHITPKNLSDAWDNETTSVGRIRSVLAQRKATPIPWSMLVNTIDSGVNANLFEIIDGGPEWPCTPEQADNVHLKVLQPIPDLEPSELTGPDVEAAWGESQTATLRAIKTALQTKKGFPIPDEVFRAVVTKAINTGTITLSEDNEDFLNRRVQKPAWVGHTESPLTDVEIQDLSEAVGELIESAPELNFKFRLVITAKGETPSAEMLEQINQVLASVTDSLKFDDQG